MVVWRQLRNGSRPASRGRWPGALSWRHDQPRPRTESARAAGDLGRRRDAVPSRLRDLARAALGWGVFGLVLSSQRSIECRLLRVPAWAPMVFQRRGTPWEQATSNASTTTRWTRLCATTGLGWDPRLQWTEEAASGDSTRSLIRTAIRKVGSKLVLYGQWHRRHRLSEEDTDGRIVP